ncbi:MAG: substrate-binding domain-containing protein [Natronomonas sp.]|uniref:ABC transporter substrate-binding protein n=1 Tax=Natronomonas sp. TaxID=2184060 RepID=UPI0028706447|nr:substrate-binding domain-containing protein [Natronomonas sp.]MDR9430820.1 substrate-binding domain-containing protein [Natronomonas sp.]
MSKQDDESRRDFLRFAGGVAGAATVGGLSGCLGGDGNGNTASEGSDGGGGASVDELSYWAVGTTNPEDWSLFKDETGINVNYSAAAWDPGETVTKLVQGTASQDFDVVGNDTTLTGVLQEQGAINPTNLQELPNWEYVYDEVKNSGPTEIDGEQHSLSSVQNGDSVAYLPDEVGDPGSVNSYGILFDEEFQGKTSLETGWATAFHKVALYLQRNNMADLEDIAEPKEEDIDKVVNFLLEQKDSGQFRTFWSGWQTAVNLLAKEEVIAMDTWEPVVFSLRDQGMNAEYLEPNEGYSLWAIGPWLTNKGNENRGASESLVNWMMGGWYNAQITTIRGYLSSSELGIDYAEESDEFDADFIQQRHDEVRSRFSDDVSVYGNRYPDSFSYLNSQWNRLTS